MSEPRDPTVTGSDGAPETAPRSSAPTTDLRTYMIADIRGYTTYTREKGDEAGAALAARFAELVAEVVAETDGDLLELRGDEALVSFISARKALRAAVDLQARFATEKLPREVGIGLDAGEAIPVGEGFRGSAINLAARLCANAAGGETLASEAVIHLAAKVDGISFVDARQVKLKGYDQPVRAIVVVPADRARGRRVATDYGGSASRWRPAAFLALAVVTVLALAFGVISGFPVLVGKPSEAPTSGPTAIAGASASASASAASAMPSTVASSAATPSPSADPLAATSLPLLAFYDPATDGLTSTTPLEGPRNLAFFAGGSYWILGDNRFHRIDPQTHQVTQRINVPLDEPSGYAWDDDYIWITDLAGPRVVRIDQQSGTSKTFDFSADSSDTSPAGDVTVGADSVWLARTEINEITRLDRETGEVQSRLPFGAWGLAFGGDGLWWWREGTIGRIDPITEQLAFDPVVLSTDSILNNIYMGDGDAWTSQSSSGQVFRLGRSGNVTTFALAPGVGEMAATETTMWVTNQNTGALTGIDFITGETDRVIDTGHATLAVASGGDELMVAVGPTVQEIISGLDGSVLMAVTRDLPWSDPAPDPPMNWNAPVRQMLNLACVHLLNYPDEPGAAGLALQPELAAGPPTISADGRTYTFTIRPGFRFSPPSNEEVTAETIRQTLERALSPVIDQGSPGPQIFGGIQGAAEFREGTADHVEGLTASGDQLTITLNEPAPELLDALATSFACPVPLGTPVLRSGLKPDPPVSGAGPYYLAQTVRKRLVIFKKNPNYTGDRPQPFDAIAVQLDTAAPTAIAMVNSGKADVAIFAGDDPTSGMTSTLAADWGPGSEHAAAGDQRWFGAAGWGTDFLALNATRAAFKDPDVRRAVSLALDREALASIWVTAPSTQLLISSVRGSPQSDGSVERDLDTARSLMAGKAPLRVTMQGYPDEWGCQPCRDFELAIVGQLSEIGITVDVRRAAEFPDTAFDPGSDVDLLQLGTGADYPDPYLFLRGLADDAWLSDDTLTELDGIGRMYGEERAHAAAALADRLVHDDYLVIPTTHQLLSFYVSERLGCQEIQPAIKTVNLLKLCVDEAEVSAP